MEIPQRADGRPVYLARYSLDDDGSWLIAVDTERGEARIHAARLGDIERRGYEAAHHHAGRPMGTFDVTFVHEIEIDLTDQRSLTA
jgi:hypothetical protein